MDKTNVISIKYRLQRNLFFRKRKYGINAIDDHIEIIRSAIMEQSIRLVKEQNVYATAEDESVIEKGVKNN